MFSPFHWRWALPLLAAAVAIAAALAGILVTGARRWTRVAEPLSGALLLGVALFGLLPELAQEIGWIPALVLFALGYFLLSASSLHRFTIPLIATAALHTFIDGWGLASLQSSGSLGVRIAFPMAVMLHKAPEGLALGAMLESSTGSKRRAFAWVAAVELITVAGSAVGFALAAGAWISYLLAVTGGSFVYLGAHAVRGLTSRQSHQS